MKANLIVFFSLFLLSFSALAESKQAVDLYHKANIAYQKQDYSSAISNYEQLIKMNRISPEVYYNLGNAWFKTGNISKAILNYERAHKLDPEDEDINFNMKIASLKVVDKIEAVPQVFYKRWINSIASILPGNSWSTIFIISIWLLAGSIAAFLIIRETLFKKISFILILIFGTISIVFYTMASRSYSIGYEEQHAVVMSPSVYIKSSPNEKGNDLFILHEGTRVEVLEELDKWKKIRIANGTVGWMNGSELEII